MPNTDKHWREFGKSDPYFGVLADEKFKSGALNDDTLAEFFETGRAEIADTLKKFQASFGKPQRGSCLDFGCGVGRNTVHLADHFDTVTAVDVSPHMLVEAEQNAAKKRMSNIVFRHTVGDDRFDFTYSYIVLQHIHPRHGLDVLNELLDHVSDNGGGMIHVVFRVPPNIEKLNSRMDAMPWLWGFRNLRKGRKFGAPRMATYAYPIDAVLAAFHDAGIRSIFSEFTDHGGHIGMKIFFRKSE